MTRSEQAGGILAVDPGRDKCGAAALAGDGTVLWQDVVATADLEEALRRAAETFSPARLVIGNGTTSGNAEQRIRAVLPDLPMKVVDEYRTTEMARARYWQAHPPQGWRRLLPVTMQAPPVPVDDFVAVILARRELGLE